MNTEYWHFEKELVTKALPTLIAGIKPYPHAVKYHFTRLHIVRFYQWLIFNKNHVLIKVGFLLLLLLCFSQLEALKWHISFTVSLIPFMAILFNVCDDFVDFALAKMTLILFK